jgi:hypothetical protein
MPANMNVNYAHVRLSNGKLNIVISIWANSGVAITETSKNIFNLELSNNIYNKLYPFSGVRLSKQVVFSNGLTTKDFLPITIETIKEAGYLKANIYIPPVSSTLSLSNWRFEFNFILS